MDDLARYPKLRIRHAEEPLVVLANLHRTRYKLTLDE